MFEQDAEKKKTRMAEFLKDVFPPFVQNLENLLEKNGGKFFVGNDVSHYFDFLTITFLSPTHWKNSKNPWSPTNNLTWLPFFFLYSPTTD